MIQSDTMISLRTGKKIDFLKYGIDNVQNVFYNLSYEELFQHETNPKLEGFEKGFITNTGAVSVDTGIFTGRSPKDKYIVKEPGSEENIWWKVACKKSSDNKVLSEEHWTYLQKISAKELLTVKSSFSYFNRQIAITNYNFKGSNYNFFGDISYVKNLPGQTIIFGGNYIVDKFRKTIRGDLNFPCFR